MDTSAYVSACAVMMAPDARSLHIVVMLLPSFRDATPFLAGLLLAGVLLACGGRESATPGDSTRVALPLDSAPPSLPLNGWDPGEGPALFVSEAAGVAIAVFPEFTDSTLSDTSSFPTPPLVGQRVALFGRGGDAGQAVLVAGPPPAPQRQSDGEGCTEWPRVRLDPAGDRSAARRPGSKWTVGLALNNGTAIRLDSLQSLGGADSARLAIEITRLASGLPNDTAQAFVGLPFSIRTGYRLRMPRGGEAIVAELVRKLGAEANPREQHVLLVTERATPGAPLQAAYSERSSGPEEAVETREVLAALLLGHEQRPTIVLARDFYEGMSYTLLERTGSRMWRVRWTSAYAGC